jgi:two-component system LytT family response regulator
MDLTAVVIEDEFKVREVFIELLEHFCPEIKVVGQTDNIKDGYDLIVSKKPAVVFLDIEMPGGNGFELLLRFDKIPFETVFVSSYGHYAIRALKLSALDYLLKPVILEDVLQIPDRLKEAITLKQNALKYELLKSNLTNTEQEKKLIIQSKKNLEYVNISDILYLKGEGNYTAIFLQGNKKFLVSKTLKEYESILCEEKSTFLRTHKTFIVNTSHIKKVDRGEECAVLLCNDIRLEVSRRKKQELIDKMNSMPKTI